MSTTLSDRIAPLPHVVASSKSPGFVEKPTVEDLAPAGTGDALRQRLGLSPRAEYVTTAAGREAFWADLGRPAASWHVAHDAEAFWADLGRPGGNETAGRPSVERVTDPAAIEAAWADLGRP